MADSDDDAWFAPKLYGIGAGLPIAWQGWAVLGGYVVCLTFAHFALLPRHRNIWWMVIAALTIGLIAITAQHTRGGWRWRWGDPD